MAKVNLGKVALTANGTWNNANVYDKLDIVNYNGNSYIAKTSVPSGIAITNEQYWQLLAEKGETGFGSEWGNIGGDIQDQEDLYGILNHVLTTDDIDDTAGDGDTNKLWSADKNYQN